MSEERAGYMVNGQPAVVSEAHQRIEEISEYYAMIPDDLIRSGNPSAVLVYGALDRIGRGGSEISTAYSYLASFTGLGTRTIQRALAWLQEHQYIEVIQVGGGRDSNRYRLPFRSAKMAKHLGHELGQNGQQIESKRVIERESVPPDNSSVANAPSELSCPQGGANATSAESNGFNPNPTVWPEWYSLLYGIEGFKTSLAAAGAWKDSKGVSDDIAERMAYRLRDWWPTAPKRRRQNGDPYMTWQRFCRDELASAPARASPRRGGESDRSKFTKLKEEVEAAGRRDDAPG